MMSKIIAKFNNNISGNLTIIEDHKLKTENRKNDHDDRAADVDRREDGLAHRECARRFTPLQAYDYD